MGPLKANDAVLLARYATFFSSSDLDVLPVSPAAFDRVVPGSSGDTLPNFSELGRVSPELPRLVRVQVFDGADGWSTRPGAAGATHVSVDVDWRRVRHNRRG